MNMGFENESAVRPDRNLASDDSKSKFSDLLFEDRQTANDARDKPLHMASYEDLFGSPVIDYRLAPQQYSPVENKDYCDTLPKTNNLKDSLSSAKMGESMLNRMYEMAALAPRGRTEPKDFESVFGKDNAAKMNSLGLMSIDRQGSGAIIELKEPIEFGNSNGGVTVGAEVSFDIKSGGGSISFENLTGVTGHKGFFSVPIEQLDIQPREGGYVSATVNASMFSKIESQNNPLLGQQAKLCAFPNGKIYH